MIVVLTVVGLLSGGFLATVGELTKERIALNRQQEIDAAILEVIPGISSSVKVYEEENLAVYTGKNEQGNLQGYAVYAKGSGFQDKISLIFGINPSITILHSLSVLDQKETPGLGAKITDQNAFLQYWKNRDTSQSLILRKPPAKSPEDLNPHEVNAITGATISSEKVLEIVNFSLKRLQELKSSGKLRRTNEDAR
jgi:RnfABCDGE-type electron transport complex G subunit